MTALITVILLLISVSFLCSILESIILSVTEPFIQTLVEKGKKSGALLKALKERINDPISAILSLNTISNTAGAAVAGAIALRLFGNRWMALFSGALTLLILVFAEIIPKTLGASYWKTLAPAAAYILRFLVVVLKPITVPVNALAHLISRRAEAAEVTREEVFQSIRLGYLQGVIESSEFEVVSNILKLKELRVHDIMTPRTVVYWLAPDATTGTLEHNTDYTQFSRLPLYDQSEDRVVGMVLRRDIILKLAQGETDVVLRDMSKDITFIPESLTVFDLLGRLVAQQVHQAAVINEFGDFGGIVTMEDAIEALLGREIVDESDRVVDMRALARKRMRERFTRGVR